MKTSTVAFRMPQNLIVMIDQIRGDEPMSSFGNRVFAEYINRKNSDEKIERVVKSEIERVLKKLDEIVAE